MKPAAMGPITVATAAIGSDDNVEAIADRSSA
jgi:hypothetical protein